MFPLHAAVWRDDAAELRRLLAAPRPEDSRGPGGVDEWDNHGNAPLHLAIILNHPQCVRVLVEAGRADCRLQSRDGWSPMAEAACLGRRDLLRYILAKRNAHARAVLAASLPIAYQCLEALPNFQVEMHWKFRSWIPFVSRLAPSDTTVIYKYASAVRLDTTIAGFSGMRWVRGKLSFVSPGRLFATKSVDRSAFSALSIGQLKTLLVHHRVPLTSMLERSDLETAAARILQGQVVDLPPFMTDRLLLIAVDHQKEECAVVADDLGETLPEQLDRVTNMHLGVERRITRIVPHNLTVAQAKTGLWPFQAAHTEVIDGYSATVYDIGGITLEAKTRSEHVVARKASASAVVPAAVAAPAPAVHRDDAHSDGSDEDLFYDAETGLDPVEDAAAVATGPADDDGAVLDEGQLPTMETVKRMMADLEAPKADLPPPPKPSLTMDQYFDRTLPDQGSHPRGLGRPVVQSTRSHTFRSKVWLVDDYPLSRAQLLDVLRALRGASSVVDKIVDFLELDLPPGFPIRMEVPLVPGVALLISFRQFQTAPEPPLTPLLFTGQGFPVVPS